MAYKGSLFQVLNRDGTIKGEVVFDSIVSEQHEVENEVTEFPVDSGFVISDHTIRKNRVLALEIVSVRHAFEGRRVQGSRLLTGNVNKVKEDFDLLTSMVQDGIRCNVVTILGAYTNCAIRKMKTKQDVNSSTVMRASLILKEMNVVGEDPTTSKQALFDTANSTTGANPDTVLKNLLGDSYEKFSEANEGSGF